LQTIGSYISKDKYGSIVWDFIYMMFQGYAFWWCLIIKGLFSGDTNTGYKICMANYAAAIYS